MSSFPAVRLRLVVASLTVLVLVGLALHLATPRNRGVEGDWSTKAVDGRVIEGRAVVSGDNTALDLRTGKTVTLGSVSGGTPFVADDRLIIASTGRVDSARLDATTRWTWRAPAGSTVTPLAASGGSTLVLVCPTTGTCQLVGLDVQGRRTGSPTVPPGGTPDPEAGRCPGSTPRASPAGAW